MSKLSFIIPFYNEEYVVKNLFLSIKEAINQCKISDHEIICIDDGYTDNTLDELNKERELNKNCKIISLTRNFGHQAAISTGLEVAEGDYILVIDADLQDPPIVLNKLLEKIKQGYEIIYCVRNKRESIVKNFFYKSFLFIAQECFRYKYSSR